MKKIVYTGLLILSTLSLTSCVREYTCQCLITYSGQPGLPDPTTKEYTYNNTYDEAQAECEAKSTTFTKDGITKVEKCELF